MNNIETLENTHGFPAKRRKAARYLAELLQNDDILFEELLLVIDKKAKPLAELIAVAVDAVELDHDDIRVTTYNDTSAVLDKHEKTYDKISDKYYNDEDLTHLESEFYNLYTTISNNN